MGRIYLLRLSNYEYFLYVMTRTGAEYLPPHQILSELESLVVPDINCKNYYNIDINEQEYAVFEYQRTSRENNNIYKVYDFKQVVCR